ncbi:hypothetical protein MPER_11935 [Moniliophthora perniciosa FA553]|nr:hypothetical protein MPER_11935 [Moniliophthora perniciosa FA553]
MLIIGFGRLTGAISGLVGALRVGGTLLLRMFLRGFPGLIRLFRTIFIALATGIVIPFGFNFIQSTPHFIAALAVVLYANRQQRFGRRLCPGNNAASFVAVAAGNCAGSNN